MKQAWQIAILGMAMVMLVACSSGNSGTSDGDVDIPEYPQDGDSDTELADTDSVDDEPEAEAEEDAESPVDGDLDTEHEPEVEVEQDEPLPCDNPATYFRDQDTDGFGDPDQSILACELPEGYVTNANDCAPEQEFAYPGSHEREVPHDGIDTDCDGLDACRDINCDGWPDIVFAQTNDGEEYAYHSVIYFGSETGYNAENKLDVPTLGAMGVDVGDFDKDGYVDLAFAAVQDGSSRNVNSVIHYGGPQGVDLSRRVDLPTIGCADATVVDADKDGWLDVIFANRYRGPIPLLSTYTNNSYIYRGGPNGFSMLDRIELSSIGASRSWAGDLNGDGQNEILFAGGVAETFATQTYLYWGSEEGWSDENRWSLTSVFAEGMLVADLNGDTHKDVLLTTWACLISCSKANRIYWGSASGPNVNTFTQIEGITGAVDVKAADVDHDNTVDLIFANGAVDAQSGDMATTSYIYFGAAGGYSEQNRLEFYAVAASEAGVGDLNGDGWVDVVFASHYAEDEFTAETSQVYYNSPNGFERGNPTLLPTRNAAGMKIIGNVYRP
jgi:hypothetical protein